LDAFFLECVLADPPGLRLYFKETTEESMLHRIPQGLWIAGTVVIVLSWMHVVPTKVGWIGFAIALFGTLLGYCRKSPPAAVTTPAAPASPTVAAQLDELSRLRDRGDVTEEEFLRRKKALLGE
jgi:hypothetical protein